MKTPFKSFADIPKDVLVKVMVEPPRKDWIEWEPSGIKRRALNEATVTLRTWLDARLADLVREKVHLEDIAVVHHGGRTMIRVCGTTRFEFKIKCTMEGK